MEAREEFTNITESQIKCAAGLNMCGERIKVIDKGNRHVFCLASNAIETWEHVVLCEKMNNKRNDWVNRLKNKINDALKKVKTSTCESKIDEMIKEFRNHFNRGNMVLTNKQVLGMREVFRD